MPRIDTRELFTIRELKELDEQAFNRAIDKARELVTIEFTLEECVDSLKALIEHIPGVKLTDYSIGCYDRSFVRVSFACSEIADLSGARACAWLENNLFYFLRIKWHPIAKSKQRQEFARYIASYRACNPAGKCGFYLPDNIKPCPLTGMCYDDFLLDAIRKAIRDRSTIKEALESLGDELSRLLEQEQEYLEQEEQVIEMIEANGFEYTRDGKQV